MHIIDTAHSLGHAQFPNLETLRDTYGWSSRNHRIFDRMFQIKSTSLHRDTSLADTLEFSAQKLVNANPELVGAVDYLVYCHALNEVTPCDSNTLGHIAQTVFHSSPEILSVTYGSCASAILAIDMLRHNLEDSPKNIVILTGEKCFFDLLKYAENNGLFGEASSATYLKSNALAGTQVVATSTGSFPGIYSPVANANKEVSRKYDQEFMPRILASVTDSLQQAGIAAEQIDVILPTHLSPFTPDRVADRLGIPKGRVFKDNIATIGHCFCGDMFINLQSWKSQQPPLSRPYYALSFAAGMTGSHASIILKIEETP